ncbi:uncharacterized protein LOC141909098 [Tubulanus polymorphus]|uniref:uncharacterized protein LOC141909098 n=1 Tax=Tubulanus polymorphus TaxID=672921 RepID=UPI003DA35FAC
MSYAQDRRSAERIRWKSRPLHRKLILVGDRGVGKTQIFRNFVVDAPSKNRSQPSPKTESHVRSFRTVLGEQDKLVEVRLFDMLNSEPHSTGNQYYRGADGVLLVFSENCVNSMNNLLNVWIRLVKARSDEPYPAMFLVKVSKELNEDPKIWALAQRRRAPECVTRSQFDSFARGLREHVRLEGQFEIAPGVFARSSVDEMFQKIVPVLIASNHADSSLSMSQSIRNSQEERQYLRGCGHCFGA